MSRIAREPATVEEIQNALEAARLSLRLGRKQAAIADELGVKQPQVSKWLRWAKENGYVETVIRVPRVIELQAKIRRLLPPTFREVRVCPSGEGKNSDNLGDVAAGLLMEAIVDVQMRNEKVGKRGARISIALSSGHTLRKVVEAFVARVKTNADERARIDAPLAFYPAAVFWDQEIKAYYPATLVTTLWTELHDFLNGRVHAYAPVLPASYYSEDLWKSESKRRRQAITDSGAAAAIAGAEDADIVVLGIGTLDDATYPLLLNRLRIRNPRRVWAGREKDAELIYAPFTSDPHNVGKRLVRVSLEAIREAARRQSRWVIGVAGGANKTRAIAQVLSADPPVLNALVTCATAARSYIETTVQM